MEKEGKQKKFEEVKEANAVMMNKRGNVQNSPLGKVRNSPKSVKFAVPEKSQNNVFGAPAEMEKPSLPMNNNNHDLFGPGPQRQDPFLNGPPQQQRNDPFLNGPPQQQR